MFSCNSQKALISFTDNETKEIIEFCSDDVIITEFSIDMPKEEYTPIFTMDGRSTQIPKPLGLITGTISFKCPQEKFNQIFYDKSFKPKLRNKKVDDCDIKELLYAVRQKIK
jgi:hypothetical protein